MGKHLCRSCFIIKVSDLFSPATLLKRDSNTGYRVLFVKSAKVLRAPIFKNICQRPASSLILDNIFFFYLRKSTAGLSIKIQTMSQVLNVFKVEILCFIYFDVIIRQRLKKKFKPVKWSKNLWYCATADTAHAQRSYLTVAEWRSDLRSWSTLAHVTYFI